MRVDIVGRLLGDFFLEAKVAIADISLYYGLDLSDYPEDMTLEMLVYQQLGETPALGESFHWQGLTWVVARVCDWQVRVVGLKLPAH
ncbi:transporter associated domain-containing protein [Vibrio mangrovi]|uniref:K(+)/H(+) antiporter NhaP2 n=1 Tax=Vibrio mangrovi TaxID=474394 RepID=A0A1Y6J3S9_9VIBR|nr:transporter associated domain-containing protein [Vibrio mangrovi]MDW6005105.1 transporter associated domain-containing protein [Vibrio mangrovi]SMS02973.1 K(+)/H(+) antiporter NhaP2 [Vibrio mangrovi]